MRQAMTSLSNERLPFPTDARSRGYIDTALIDALAKELPAEGWGSLASNDAEAWEVWCYRAVLVCVALAGTGPMPPVEEFLAEWVLTPEDWATERGQNLKAHALLFDTLGKRADAYGTRLLALPLVEVSNPDEVWRRVWDATSIIREIVELVTQTTSKMRRGVGDPKHRG